MNSRGTRWKSLKGILPITKSTLLNEEPEPKLIPLSKYGHSFNQIRFYGVGGWRFHGQGSSYDTCGKMWKGQKFKGCLSKSHPQTAVVKFNYGNCKRSTCPKCSDTWLTETTQKVSHRITEAQKYLKKNGFRNTKPIHVTISPPSILHGFYEDVKFVKKERRKIYNLAKEAGIIGGSVIYHPYRERCAKCGGNIGFKTHKCVDCGGTDIVWYFSPHFHLFCFGWVTNVEKIESRTGYVVTNHGVRKTIQGTVYYQLSHCGIHPQMNTISYFGEMSYNKLKGIPKLILRSEKCPLCGNKLLDIWYRIGKPPPLNPESINYTDPLGWVYEDNVPRRSRERNDKFINRE